MALILALATAAAPPPAVPDTPAGHAMSAWLTAFDSGDRTTFSDFLKRYEPQRLNRLDDLMDFRKQTGGFDLKTIESSTPAQVVAVVEDRLNEQFARMTVNVDASGSVTSIGLEAIPTPAAFAPPHMSQADLIAALDAKMPKDTAAGFFSGAVLVAKNGTPVFEHAYGLADRAQNVPNTVDTLFRLGSMNKMFTATSIMQLVQAGKVGLDDPLGKYLTAYPNADVAKVTIRQLLTHTGGTGDIFTPEFDKHRLDLKTLTDYEALYGTRGVEFPPGSKYEYSNYGFILLGLVVEKAGGESYYDYVHEHIFVPAGMTSTASQPESESVPNRSIGYTDVDGKLVPNTDTLPYRGTSAGGGYSTVGDLLKFATALQNHTLLDAANTDLMTTGKIDVGGGMRYAFGFGDYQQNGTRCFGHSGGAPGMNGELSICPAAGYVVVVLANLDPGAATREAEYITNRLPAP